MESQRSRNNQREDSDDDSRHGDEADNVDNDTTVDDYDDISSDNLPPNASIGDLVCKLKEIGMSKKLKIFVPLHRISTMII